MLLREWLGRRARTKTPIDRAPSNRVILWLERTLPNRTGVALTVLMLLGSAGYGIVKGGHFDDFIAALSDTRNALANSAGFRITTVAINGRKQLSQDEVLAIGGVNGRSSLLFLDAATVRDKLKANPWIADATILKLYPGRLQIDIVERTAYALWQQEGRLSVISEDGAVLEPFVARRFVSLPLVVGKGADSKARDFLALLDRYPQVRAVTKAAIFVGERRWNLQAEGRPRHSPAGKRRRQRAGDAEQARQGRKTVLARHRRRGHAPAGPVFGAAFRRRGQGPRGTVQGQEDQEKGR